MIVIMKQPLILLFGQPRSGTTWIGKIFDSHPDTLYRHQPDSGSALKSLPLIAPVADYDKYRSTVTHFVDRLANVNSPRSAGTLPIFPKSYLSSTGLLLRRFAVLATKVSEPFISDIPIPEFADLEKARGIHVVWKSIESLGRLGVIVLAVADSKTVLILRHPGGYIASVLNGEARGQFSSTAKSSDDFPVLRMLLEESPHKQRNPSDQAVKTMHPVERLAWRWVLYNEIALAGIEGIAGCTVLRYEDLCAHPVAKAKELIQFTGLTWHHQVETFVQRSTSRQSEHYYSVFKDPLEASTKWSQQLSAADVERIMGVVRQSQLVDFYPDVNAETELIYA
jgi:hypothetical protein